jgi:hypothetical protein
MIACAVVIWTPSWIIYNLAVIFQKASAAVTDGLVTVIESGWPQPQREQVARRCGDVLRRIWEDA